MPRPNWSAPPAPAADIPMVMDLATRAGRPSAETDARERRVAARRWAELNKAAAGGDTAQTSIALQMALQMERVKYW
jgi:hypothetical protein